MLISNMKFPFQHEVSFHPQQQHGWCACMWTVSRGEKDREMRGYDYMAFMQAADVAILGHPFALFLPELRGTALMGDGNYPDP